MHVALPPFGYFLMIGVQIVLLSFDKIDKIDRNDNDISKKSIEEIIETKDQRVKIFDHISKLTQSWINSVVNYNQQKHQDN